MPKWTPPKNDKYFVSAQNSYLCHYSSNTLISEIFIKTREGAFRDVSC